MVLGIFTGQNVRFSSTLISGLIFFLPFFTRASFSRLSFVRGIASFLPQ